MHMQEWRMTTIAECSTILGDGLHGTPKYDENGEYAFINGNNLHNGKIVIKPDTKRVGLSEYEKHKKELTDRTVLVSINGTLGNVAVYNGEKVILGKSACYFNVSTDCDVHFMRYVVSSPHFQQYINSVATGTTIKNVSLKQMREYSFPIPELKEQQRIAQVLYLLDQKIENNQKMNDNLQQQAMALYASMFLDNPALETTAGTLKDIADITMGQSPSGSSYNEDGNGEVFYQGRAEFGYRFPTRRLYTTEPKRMAEVGDVLLSVRAPVGDLNVAYERCCIGRGLGAIHGRNGYQSFVLYTMFALRPQLDVYNGEGTVFGSINRSALNDMPIDIPSEDAIAAFEAIARPMDDMIRSNYEENCRLQELRDSLLPRLMSGEVDVSDIDI